MAAEFEPDREWKEQERRRIKSRLQNLASKAKTNYENRRGQEPDRGPLFEAEYDKAIQELKKVAMDEYQKSIRKERQRRQAEATGSNQQDIAPMAFCKCTMDMTPLNPCDSALDVDAIPPTVDWQQQGIINEKACDRTRAGSREDSKGTTAPGLATPLNVNASSSRTKGSSAMLQAQ
ncbi:hypothetical protein BKA70DRAFT_840758 [Coprinopsis sp. MPI-PUGE-AT-0042]|nr:hypothetical protein BKA70DRAFT_840758 [Coprinopsis sp. MPI-PUGE-AT-0042]